MPQQFGEESNASLRVTPVTESFDFVEVFASTDDCSPEVENKEEALGLLAFRLAFDMNLARHPCCIVAVLLEIAPAQLKVAPKCLDDVRAGTKPSTSWAKIQMEATITDIRWRKRRRVFMVEVCAGQAGCHESMPS